MGWFGPPEPCYATLMMGGRIELANASRAARTALRREGIEVSRNLLGGGVVRYAATPEADTIGNPDFHRVVLALVRAGIGFGEDQHGWGPADIVRELQSRGILAGAFKRLGWKDHQRVLLDNPPGWTPNLSAPLTTRLE